MWRYGMQRDPRSFETTHCPTNIHYSEYVPTSQLKDIPTSLPTSSPTLKPTPQPTNVVTNELTYCGCTSCTPLVRDSLATDGAGTYSCGSRITFLQEAQGYGTAGACAKVESEFLNLCLCGPSSCNTSSQPVSVPALSPSSSRVACTAVPQSELPAGSWATLDDHCKFCVEGRIWWPCNQDPALCICTGSL